MNLNSTILTLRLVTALSLVSLSVPHSVEAAEPVSLGNPVTVSAGGGTMQENGDGLTVSWTHTGTSYDFRLYDADLNVVKQFSIDVMESVGAPMPVFLKKGAGKEERYFLTKNIFNTDDLYEVRFDSGDLYNEQGRFLGRIESNVIYVTENETKYVSGSSEIVDADESQVWAEKHQATIPEWMMERFQLVDFNHSDFGAPALAMMADAAGNDVVGTMGGYNWFITQMSYSMHNNPRGYASLIPYWYLYMTVDRCNQLVAGLKDDAATATKATVLADAYALRAWSYLSLAQRYQFTYSGNESEPCVPLVDENNSAVLSTTGVPRSTVAEVYDFILADLDKAIALLETDATAQADICPSAPKMMVSAAAAYGLRARANLVMRRYPAAAADARKAIRLFGGEPYALSDIKPGSFCNINDKSWMWGLHLDESYPSYVTGNVASFTSFMSPFCTAGYAAFEGRFINRMLFNSIPVSDVRRTLFFDADGLNAVLNDTQKDYFDQMGLSRPYQNLKFGTVGAPGAFSYETLADFPMMRVEEMHYIVAEAMAMAGSVSGAGDYLAAFVKQYRDPSFTVPAGVTAEQLRDIIWEQRRIEFWGEGLSFYDLMRLEKGVNRIGGGYPAETIFNIAPDDPALLLRFPAMFRWAVNKALEDEAANNPESDRLTLYNDAGQEMAFSLWAYTFDSEYNLVENTIWSYDPVGSVLHDGWKQFTAELPGTGNVTVHFDPATGKVEIPAQNPDPANPALFVADAASFYGSADLAGASGFRRGDDGSPKFILDIVCYTQDASGNRSVDGRRITRIGYPLETPDFTISGMYPYPESGYYVIYTEDSSRSISCEGYLTEGYKLYIDILPEDFGDRKAVVEHLLQTTPATGSLSCNWEKTGGRWQVCWVLADTNGNILNISASPLVIKPFPFKENAAGYGDAGEWGAWKEGGTCTASFRLLNNCENIPVDFRVRRNIADPDLIQISFVDWLDRNYYVDLATCAVSSPKTDIRDYIGGSFDYLYCSANHFSDNDVSAMSYMTGHVSAEVAMKYEFRQPGDDAVETVVQDMFILPCDLREILEDGYVPAQPQNHSPRVAKKLTLHH